MRTRGLRLPFLTVATAAGMIAGCGGTLSRSMPTAPLKITEQNRLALQKVECLSILPVKTDKTDFSIEDMSASSDNARAAKSTLAKTFRWQLLSQAAGQKPAWVADSDGCGGPARLSRRAGQPRKAGRRENRHSGERRRAGGVDESRKLGL